MRCYRLTLLVIFLLSGILLCPGTAPAQQNRGMGVPAAELPEDLQKVNIKDLFVPVVGQEVGVLHGLSGHVVVVHRESGTAYFGKPGDTIYENDELTTLGDSRCRIRFISDDVVNMAPFSRFSVDAFQDRRGVGKKETVFSLVRGKAMFYALRLFRYKEMRFQVKTPTAIVGVRGTQFALDLIPPHIREQFSRVRYWVYETPDGYVVACADGVLEVRDPQGNIVTDVPANTAYNSYTGQSTYDPTNRTLNQIQNDSQVGGGDGGGTSPPPSGGSLGWSPQGLPPVDLFGDNQTDITQQQTGENTLSSEPGSFQPFQGSSSSPLYGYFSAFLFYRSDGHVREAFASSSLQQTDPLHHAYAYGASNSSNYILASENASGNDEGDVYLDGHGNSGPFDIEGRGTYLGQYDYLQWGYHQSNNPPLPVVDGTNYELINRFWFVEGYPTDTSDLASLSGDYTYSGGVRATYYSQTEQADLTGTYTSQVHFGSSYIHDFQMSASGGGHTIDFTQTGSVSMSADGEFALMDPGDGTFNIDGGSISYWYVNGAHFGPGAAEQGGAFAGYCPSTHVGTHGIFYGKRTH